MKDSGRNRTALVTGASRGIGREIAGALAADGYDLTILARTPEAISAAAEELRASGVAVDPVSADVTSEEEVRAAVAVHRERHGSLDLLVNNAGMGILAPIEKLSTSHMDLQYRVNLRHVAVFYRECLDLLETAAATSGSATVINISSISGKLGERELTFYTAVKHGVVGLTRAMNAELQERGIKSCVVCPGFVDTDLSDYQKVSVPPEQMIQTRDLARAVRFVAELSDYCIVPEIVLQRRGDPLQVG
jgi:NAD(P)-dependent dehydrogenase (short-subunit alcohol dehydrogenase family)